MATIDSKARLEQLIKAMKESEELNKLIEVLASHDPVHDIASDQCEEEAEKFPELKGKCNYLDQERPRRHCHEINGYWCDDQGCVDYVPQSVAQQIKIDKLTAENVELKRSLGEPEQAKPVHDIASERWALEHGPMTGCRYIVIGNVTLATIRSATGAQAELMTAAPMLADMLRSFIAGQCKQTMVSSDMAELVDASISLLRDLGVPNVAPWYKEDE